MTALPLPPRKPDFGLHGSIGTGQSNPGDVLKLRRALQRTGHGRFPQRPAQNVTPGLMDAIESFQRDFGLKRDGLIEPGGPTERTIGFALAAMEKDGEAGLSAVREHFQKRAGAGFTFRPDPDDKAALLWRDGAGRLVTDEQAEKSTGDAPSRTAMMRTEDMMRKAHRSRILEGGGAGGGVPRGTLGAGPTLRAIGRQILGITNEEVSRPPRRGDPNSVSRTVPLDTPPPNIPPYPSESGIEPFDKEEYLAEERGPTLTISPIPERGRPQIEVFPDMSDELEQWLVMESRGKKNGQQKDVKYIIDELYDAYERKGIDYAHAGGGYRSKTTKDGPAGQKVTERVLQPAPKVNKGSRRSDIAMKYPDIGEVDDINVVDTLVDGTTPTARERRAFEAIKSLKKEREEKGDTIKIGKSKKLGSEEFERRVDVWIEEYTDAKAERIHRTKKK